MILSVLKTYPWFLLSRETSNENPLSVASDFVFPSRYTEFLGNFLSQITFLVCVDPSLFDAHESMQGSNSSPPPQAANNPLMDLPLALDGGGSFHPRRLPRYAWEAIKTLCRPENISRWYPVDELLGYISISNCIIRMLSQSLLLHDGSGSSQLSRSRVISILRSTRDILSNFSEYIRAVMMEVFERRTNMGLGLVQSRLEAIKLMEGAILVQLLTGDTEISLLSKDCLANLCDMEEPLIEKTSINRPLPIEIYRTLTNSCNGIMGKNQLQKMIRNSLSQVNFMSNLYILTLFLGAESLSGN